MHVPLKSGMLKFQSTLPCGSDFIGRPLFMNLVYFNPRSLAGATRVCRFAF